MQRAHTHRRIPCRWPSSHEETRFRCISQPLNGGTPRELLQRRCSVKEEARCLAPAQANSLIERFIAFSLLTCCRSGPHTLTWN